MRLCLQSIFFRSPNFEFPRSQIDLSQQGKWSFLAPLLQDPEVSYTIWHRSHPILGLSNGYTSQIVRMLDDKLYKWLDPHSLEPVTIPTYFQLSEDHVLNHRGDTSVIDTEREAVQVVFDYADLIGQDHGNHCGKKLPCHMRWVETGRCEYPEPDIDSLLCNGPRQRARIESILSILRYPGLYDGSADFMLERRLGPAVRSLFAPWYHWFTSDTDSKPITRCISNPLVVISESAEITEEVRADMARNAHPTLLALLRAHGHRDVLPPYCFVYGLHISPTHISIFAHFPESAEGHNGEKSGRFCQVLLTKYYVSYGGYDDCQDDLFLQRWRLFIALFTILRHVELLEREMPQSEADYSSNAVVPGSFDGLSNQLRSRRVTKLLGHCREDLHNIRSLWNGRRLAVPSSWITPNVISFYTRCTDYLMDRSMYQPHQIAALIFHRIREHFSPLDNDILMQNHISNSYVGPDFIHPVHAPRSHLDWRSYEADEAHEQPRTLPHYFKARDFLAMAPYDWMGINIFIANIFAGFSAYSVQWKPVIRYPFPASNDGSNLCVVDFALAARAIPPTTVATIRRATSLPLTMSSPAVLIGVRSTRLEGDGQSVSQEELSALSKIMEPHINLFRLLRYSNNVILPPGTASGTIDTEPTLFCTYVKTGVVHILAFSFHNNFTSKVTGHLLDSLPLSLHCETGTDFYARMRIVIAMFTLQRQVVKICEGWNSICWPHDMSIDEHEVIVEVTGLSTPTPSADWSSLDSEAEEFALGLGSEYSTNGLKWEIEKSLERVIPWLAQVEPSNNVDQVTATYHG